MRISGKLVGSEEYRGIPNADTLGGIKYATIELPPVDVKKIKGEVEVLVTGRFRPGDGITSYARNIVYVFPDKNTDNTEEIVLPEKFEVDSFGLYSVGIQTLTERFNALIDAVREIERRGR